ncbi:MAG: preprotein translocase subunit SecA [Candidatus Kerfeldbacteria bacterium RIFCSPHIGHO2_12_FULL_48_17]|uniref:Protein translocase subunit SecA n=1 Tax=Candidatus Kerfeldbacteria bacterium RIFCSPHIGHO2_12_FULL_48_17 TaxID=1798542 RepID=A0A1G2AZB7_9BACT|nr:MAG: preprotein translocase subunit SecA [Candidatus Kerfeldbacteria bacterium RIFCSPHIGHO2_12_FULL_48_17]
MSILKKIFGDPSVKAVKEFSKKIAKINELEPAVAGLGDEQLKGKTQAFRERLKKGEKLDDMLFEAFAVVREAAKRSLGQRHYDVQLIAGLALHDRNIAEMKTGEGKTLAATLTLYANALEGKGTHLVTVNDYLARRDADWMGRIFHALGLSVGCLQNQGISYIFDPEARVKEEKDREENTEDRTEEIAQLSFKVDMENLRAVSRREAYAADITYGTNNEFGFDYLRDNMVQNLADKVQRGLHFAIIDEVDSILIDEARTPLIISAPAEKATDKYYEFAKMVNTLDVDKHYNVDEKMNSVALTQEGIDAVEKALGQKDLYQEGGIEEIHHIEQALKAKALFRLDKEYVIKDGEIVIVDEFTGRLMFGRRFSEGLHQAIEAKEGVEIKQESLTLATITLQNLFRMYEKIGGMTGTAETEAEEFGKIYGLDVVVIPTHRQIARQDHNDKIYKTELGKLKAVVQEIKRKHEAGQPVLVGTISIEKNEILGALLQREGIVHELLNAKNHEREGQIIAQAGRPGAVTVATNMAGRGVDIVLGGNPPTKEDADKVKAAGGLMVIGTERHESRRIDNQLRGRSGRQGDKGLSQFFVSLQDDLMRIFASEKISGLMNRLGLPEDMPIENKLISRSIESAQKKVEGRNFDIRKHLVEYDDVMNKHREVIYKKRNDVLEAFKTEPKKLKEKIMEMMSLEIEHVVAFHTAIEDKKKDWNVKEIIETMVTIFPMSEEERKNILNKNIEQPQDVNKAVEHRTELIKELIAAAEKRYEEFTGTFPDEDTLRRVEKDIQLRAIDSLWVEHLDQMTRLREGIGLRGYGQKDPLVEYKREAFSLFTELINQIQRRVVYAFFKIRIKEPSRAANIMNQPRIRLQGAAKEMSRGAGQFSDTKNGGKNGVGVGVKQATTPAVSEKLKTPEGKKVGRNDPCPCGSGKKYKRCHGK